MDEWFVGQGLESGQWLVLHTQPPRFTALLERGPTSADVDGLARGLTIAWVDIKPDEGRQQELREAAAVALRRFMPRVLEPIGGVDGTEPVVLPRSGGAALRFTGIMVASALAPRAETPGPRRWHDLLVYRIDGATGRPRWVLAIQYNSTVPAEPSHWTTATTERLDDVMHALIEYRPAERAVFGPSEPEAERGAARRAMADEYRRQVDAIATGLLATRHGRP